MIRWPVWIAAILLVGGAQEKTNPDLHYDKEMGFSIQKPPKKEEWEFKTSGGKLPDSQIIVAHRTEDLSVEIGSEPPGEDLGYFDPKAIVEDIWKNISKSELFKEAKKKKLESTLLPGKAAGGVRAWFLDMVLKDQEDKVLEWKIYVFVGKENQCLFKISIMGGEGTYEKNKKDLEYILSSIKTWRLPKKKK